MKTKDLKSLEKEMNEKQGSFIKSREGENKLEGGG